MTTKADQARFNAFQRIGCVACHMSDRWSPADVHHLLSGGRRRGNRYTIPLCPWHHRGLPAAGQSLKDMRDLFGPSLALTSKDFRGEYGDDEGLLALTDGLIA